MKTYATEATVEVKVIFFRFCVFKTHLSCNYFLLRFLITPFSININHLITNHLTLGFRLWRAVNIECVNSRGSKPRWFFSFSLRVQLFCECVSCHLWLCFWKSSLFHSIHCLHLFVVFVQTSRSRTVLAYKSCRIEQMSFIVWLHVGYWSGLWFFRMKFYFEFYILLR